MNRARLSYTLYYVCVAAYVPYLQLYYGSVGIDLAGIGALSAFSSFVALIASPIWGAISDRYPESKVLIPISSVIAAVGGLAMGTVGASWLLVPAVVAYSVGLAGTSPMMDVLVLHMTGADRTRYASVRAFGSLSFIIATPIIGLVIHQSYVELFYFLIPALLLAGLTSLMLPRRSTAVRTFGMTRAPMVVLHHRPIAVFLLTAFLGWTALYTQNPFLSIYLRDLGATSDQVGYLWSAQALLEVPSMLVFPLLVRRVGSERLIVLGMAVLACRQAANALFTDPGVLIGLSLMQGLGYGFLLVGSVAYVSQQSPRGTAATAQGIFNAVSFNLASIIGAGVGGEVGRILSIRTLFGISAALGAISVVLLAIAVLPGSSERLKAAREAAGETAMEPKPEPDAARPDVIEV